MAVVFSLTFDFLISTSIKLFSKFPNETYKSSENANIQDYMQKNITNVQHKNRVQKAINENKYENAIQNGWISKERANEIIKSAELDIIYSDGGDTKWNLDRYREVEKEMHR